MGNVPASFMRWRQQNQGLYFAIYASSAAVFYIIGKYTDSIRAWFWDFLPITIGSLSADWWRAFGFTVVASVIAWFFAVTLGYFLGVSAGTARVAITPDFGLRRWMGISLDVAYRSLYVIPFVLTATIAYNITFSWGFSKTYPLPRWMAGVMMIMVAGVVLGGYKVFIAIYGAVSEAKLDSVALARSLYCVPRSRQQYARGLFERLRMVVRLSDCEIAGFSRSLEDAFHLSLVAVMIVESILPAFYENFFPSSGTSHAYFGGVGRMVVAAQQSLTPRHISGILWLVLIFDGLAINMIRSYCHRRWHKHYHQQHKEVA